MVARVQLAFVLLLLLLLCVAAAKATVRVADFGGGGGDACIGACNSTCACGTLQQALDAANDGDEVWLLPALGSASVPCEGARTDRAVTLRPHPDVPGGSGVMLDCNAATTALWLDGSTREAGDAPRVELHSLTFARGVGANGGCVRATDALLAAHRCSFVDCVSSGLAAGGAVSVTLSRDQPAAAITLVDSEFRGCRSAHGRGGAVMVLATGRVDDASITVRGCTFQASFAQRDGGALYLQLAGTNARVEVGESVFSDTRGAWGGALLVHLAVAASPNAAVRILGSQFRGTVAASGGGAVCVRVGSADVSVAVERCQFERAISDDNGGAVLVLLDNFATPRALVRVADSEFRQCTSGFDGGALAVHVRPSGSSNVSVRIERCLFHGTRAVDDGGAVSLYLFAADSPYFRANISHCQFFASNAGSNGGAVAVTQVGLGSPHAALELADSQFQDTHAAAIGGALAAMWQAGGAANILLAVTRCTFATHSAGSGGAVSSHFLAFRCPAPVVTITDSHFRDTSARWNGGAVFVLTSRSGSPAPAVRVDRCSFSCTAASADGGGVYVMFGSTDSAEPSMLLRASTFDNSTAGSNGGALMVAFTAVGMPRPSASIIGSQFHSTRALQSGGAVYVLEMGADSARLAVTIASTTFEDSSALHGGALAIRHSARSSGGSVVSMTDSLFRDTRATLEGGAATVYFVSANSTRAAVRVERTRFQGCRAGGDGGAVAALFVDETADASSMMLLDCDFAQCRAGGAGGALWLSATSSPGVPSTFAATAARCSFSGTLSEAQGGAVFAALARQPLPLYAPYCPQGTSEASRDWQTSSTLTLADCMFEDVAAAGTRSVGGTAAVADGELRMERCDVRNSSAAYSGGVVFSSGNAAVLLRSVRVRGARAREHAAVEHGGAGELRVQNSSFTGMEALRAAGVAMSGDHSVLVAMSAAGPVQFEASVLDCEAGEILGDASRGQALATEQWPVHSLCDMEPRVSDGMVSMRATNVQWRCIPCAPGTYFLGAGRVEDGNVTEGRCEPCPFGAQCRGRAEAVADPGMWGVPLRNGSLPATLVRCPDGYCCADAVSCRSFDSCAPGRAGVLCGQCAPGSTGVLGSTGCRATAQCGTQWQDVLFWPTTLLAVLLFVVWQVRQAAAAPGRALAHSEAAGSQDGSLVTYGLTKALFAYYQSLPLLHMSASASSTLQAAAASVQEAFNFRVPAGSGTGVCPFVGLTPMCKEVVGLALAVAVLIALPAVQAAHAALAWLVPAAEVRLCARRCRVRLAVPPPQPHVYAAAFTSLAMLTYSTGTTAVTRLLTCVQVGDLGSRLLLQGGMECWQRQAWWQWAAAAWLGCSTLLVPMALAWGGWLLRRGAVSPGAFWLSLFLPLPCMLRWACQRLRVPPGPVNEQRATAVMARSTRAALELAYRPQLWWWDSMLLARRLLLALLALLLSQQPVVRALAGALVVLASLLLHVRFQPFSSRRVNALETWFLATLALAAVLAVRTATLLSLSAVDHETWRNHMAAAAQLLATAGFPVAGLVYAALLAWRRCRARLTACAVRRRMPAGGGGEKVDPALGVALQQRLLE